MIPDDDNDTERGYNFAYLDEQTKRMVRRAIIKAVCVPGYQVPFDSREMPLPAGWGTGGLQVTASLVGPSDVLKVIDQGTDDATNAVSIRGFFTRVTEIATTERTSEATIVQSRHRIPEVPLTEDQILVLQVPQPEPLSRLEPRTTAARTLHALADYGVMYVKLYEDIAQFGQITLAYDYPVRVHDRYLTSPSPIPRFDNQKLHHSRALTIFGAGREKRLYAIPPFTRVESLAFEDHPFTVQSWSAPCTLCGATTSYLNEIASEAGERMFVCSDTSFCEERREADAVVPTAARRRSKGK